MIRLIEIFGLLILCCPTLVLADEGTRDKGVRTSRPGAKQLPLTEEEGVWHFAIFGDRTSGPPEGVEVLRQAVSDTNLFDPDLVMTVGDLIQGYNSEEPWLDEMREFRGVMEKLAMPPKGWFEHCSFWIAMRFGGL